MRPPPASPAPCVVRSDVLATQALERAWASSISRPAFREISALPLKRPEPAVIRISRPASIRIAPAVAQLEAVPPMTPIVVSVAASITTSLSAPPAISVMPLKPTIASPRSSRGSL